MPDKNLTLYQPSNNPDIKKNQQSNTNRSILSLKGRQREFQIEKLNDSYSK